MAKKDLVLIMTPIGGAKGDKSSIKVKQEENFCDLSKQPGIIQWMDNVGIIVYKKSREKGFSVIGSLFILSHAYIEQATTERGRNIGYQTNNWWNFGPLKNKNQKKCEKISRFACFDNLDEAYEAYYDRITSTEDLIAYHNPNFNPSYPLLGVLFRRNKIPSEKEINEATRISIDGKDGTFMYCGDGNKSKYAREMQKCAKIAKTDIQTYIERRLKCLDQQKPNQQETKETNYLRFLNLWEALPVKNEIPTEKDELEKIKQEIQSQGNV